MKTTIFVVVIVVVVVGGVFASEDAEWDELDLTKLSRGVAAPNKDGPPYFKVQTDLAVPDDVLGGEDDPDNPANSQLPDGAMEAFNCTDAEKTGHIWECSAYFGFSTRLCHCDWGRCLEKRRPHHYCGCPWSKCLQPRPRHCVFAWKYCPQPGHHHHHHHHHHLNRGGAKPEPFQYTSSRPPTTTQTTTTMLTTSLPRPTSEPITDCGMWGQTTYLCHCPTGSCFKEGRPNGYCGCPWGFCKKERPWFCKYFWKRCEHRRCHGIDGGDDLTPNPTWDIPDSNETNPWPTKWNPRPTKWYPGPTRWHSSPTKWYPGPTRWHSSPTKWYPGPTRWHPRPTNWYPGPTKHPYPTHLYPRPTHWHPYPTHWHPRPTHWHPYPTHWHPRPTHWQPHPTHWYPWPTGSYPWPTPYRPKPQNKCGDFGQPTRDCRCYPGNCQASRPNEECGCPWGACMQHRPFHCKWRGILPPSDPNHNRHHHRHDDNDDDDDKVDQRLQFFIYGAMAFMMTTLFGLIFLNFIKCAVRRFRKPRLIIRNLGSKPIQLISNPLNELKKADDKKNLIQND